MRWSARPSPSCSACSRASSARVARRAHEAFPDFAAVRRGGRGRASFDRSQPQTGAATVTATNTGGTRYPWGVERYTETIRHSLTDAKPAEAATAGTHRTEVDLPGRKLVWEAELSFRSDAEAFHYDYVRRLYENGALLRERRFTESIPRDFQ